MHKLTLIRRENCGLCELALGVLSELGLQPARELYLEDDRELEDRYGWRIPVLRREDVDIELDWPFDRLKVEAFLAR